MRLNLYVEDTAGRVAYEHLARMWCESQGIPCEQVRAIAPPFNDVLDKMGLLVEKAVRDGFDCIVFVVDQEVAPERKRQIRMIHQQCEQICRSLADSDRVNVTVGLVVARTCLECWILADAQAIVEFACHNNRRGYHSASQRGDTEMLSPSAATEEITHILREVGRRANKPDTKRLKYEKSAVADIAVKIVNLDEASRRNESLAEFCERVTCKQSDCGQQPDW